MAAACIFVLSLLVATQANVHEFYAEHNYICGVCRAAVEFVVAGGDLERFEGCKDGQGREFSTACAKVRGMQEDGVRETMYDSYSTCEQLELCGTWVDSEADSAPVVDSKLVDSINNDPTSSWKAAPPAQFEGLTLGQFKKMFLGTVVDPDHVFKLKYRSEPTVAQMAALPEEHDTVTAWPYCSSVSGHVRDQSSCGSCWAFGSTEAFNDRLCISNVTSKSDPFLQLMSTEDTASCCSGFACGFSQGCNGGQPTAAWRWFETTGIPSGGDYEDRNKADNCLPYSLPPCAHHTTNTTYPECPKREYPTPRCRDECSNENYPKSFKEDKHYAAKTYSFNSVNSIMQDLVDYGSVTGAFTVYADFPSYQSGVYQHKTGSALGGHAIEIVGYGEEDGTKYWLCKNSWNDSWGDHGFFKILRGENECGIEQDVSAGIPRE